MHRFHSNLVIAAAVMAFAVMSPDPRLAAEAASGERPVMTAPPGDLLGRILEHFDRAQAETLTMVARFTETKNLKLLARPAVSHGEFYYNRPNQVRWEYLDPDSKVFIITESMYVAYYPSLKRAEEVPIKKFVGKRLFRFIGVGQSIDELGKYYEFELADRSDIPGTHLLLLRPRKKSVRERVSEMKIWVDDKTYLPRQLQYVEADGDSTVLAFHDIRVNVEVAMQRFRIDLPGDVIVSETFNGFSLGQQSF